MSGYYQLGFKIQQRSTCHVVLDAVRSSNRALTSAWRVCPISVDGSMIARWNKLPSRSHIMRLLTLVNQCLACLPHGLLYCEWTGARSTEVHMSTNTYRTGDSISLTVRSRLPACLSQWFAQFPFMSTSACFGLA
ncbi:hypothetical protein ECG_05570 [Echinococcus granulosus]|nr:hypothetical protein ECG_05570 [Echinococcus granulosus]